MKTRYLQSMALLAALLLAVSLGLPAWAEEEAFIDYAALPLDMRSETVKQEVTVRNYVDGDTTHFIVPESMAQQVG